MMKSVLIVTLGVFVGRLCTPGFADEEWVPVPLEELQRATLRRPTPQTHPTESAPKVLPEVAPPTTAPTVEPRDVKPAPPKPPRRLTPEEIARRLRSNVSSPVVPPRGYKPRKTIDTSIAKEGQAVVGRIGRVKKIPYTDAYRVTFENNRRLPYQSPRRLLPCRLLEELEAHLADHPDARYRISGETTRDTKHVYLLLQRVAVVDEGVTDVEPDEAQETSPASQPTRLTGDATSSLIEQMLQDRPGKAMKITPSPRRTAAENVRSVAPAGKRPFHPGKRDLVVDRVVRIVRNPDSEWWQARFESDNTLREPPLRILPGLRLEWIKMEREESGKADMRLRISGDVTYYKGKRYLMLRKVLYQRDMDEF